MIKDAVTEQKNYPEESHDWVWLLRSNLDELPEAREAYIEDPCNWEAPDPGKGIAGSGKLIPIDLSHADLSEANLSGAGLNEFDLSEANLSEANLRGANLNRVNLRWANLRGADLTNADMRLVNLRGADLRGADLTNADLRGADLERVKGAIVVLSKQTEDLTKKKMARKRLADVEVDNFGYDMLLIDNGADGITVKRGCLYDSTENVFARWDDYKPEYSPMPPQSREVFNTLKTHRQTVMLPLLVGALQEAIATHEAEKSSGISEPAFPKAHEIFDALKEQYQDTYPDLFTNTPIVHADEAVHEGGLKGTGADRVKGGGAGREA